MPAVLPTEVATDDDVEARAALLRVLARAARADGPDGLRVQFLGSGSTAVAAVRTKRRYVGYDLDPEYVAIAEGRIDEAKSAVAD